MLFVTGAIMWWNRVLRDRFPKPTGDWNKGAGGQEDSFLKNR